MATPDEILGAAVLAGVTTGAAHFAAHEFVGEPNTFDEAGVTEAGAAVTVTSAAVTGTLTALNS